MTQASLWSDSDLLYAGIIVFGMGMAIVSLGLSFTLLSLFFGFIGGVLMASGTALIVRSHTRRSSAP